MLAFFLKRQIDELLQRAYSTNIVAYKEALRGLVEQAERGVLSDEALDRELARARAGYLNSVSEMVGSVVRGAAGNVPVRYRLACMNAELAGVLIEEDTVYSAGIEYCLLFYAFTGKKGKPQDAVRHNHLFAAYVDSAITELEIERNG